MLGQTNAKIAGGADITVVEKNVAIVENQYARLSSMIVSYNFFNLNKTKAFRLSNGYSSGYKLYFGTYDYTPNSFTFTSISSYTLSVSSSQSYDSMKIAIADDDTFVICYAGSTLYYIPINQQYEVGEPIMLDTTISDFYRSFEILSSTRFVNFKNKDIYIYKLENGALTLEKTINNSAFSINSLCCANGNICFSSTGSKSSGGWSFKIINPDTENVLYSEDQTFGVTEYTNIIYKDGYIFCLFVGSGASSPKDKGIGNVYSCDWTNNTFTNLNFGYVDTIRGSYGFSYHPYTGRLIKVSDDLYIWFLFGSQYSFISFNMTNKVTKYCYMAFKNIENGGLGYPLDGNAGGSGAFLVEYNSQKQLIIFQYVSGQPGSSREYLCDLIVDTDVKIQTDEMTYWLAPTNVTTN